MEKCTCSWVQSFCKCEEIRSFSLDQKSKLLFPMIIIFQRRVVREQILCVGIYTIITDRLDAGLAVRVWGSS